MEEPFNPYAAGQVQEVHANPEDAVPVSSEALATMMKMKFWVKLSGLTILGVIVLMTVSLFIELSSMSPNSGGVLIILVIPLVVLGVIVARILNYSSSIEKVRKSMNSIDLSTSIKAQHSFWIVVGIVLSVIVGIWFLGFAASMLDSFSH